MTDSLRANDGVFNLEFSSEFVQQFSQGRLTTLEQVAQFNPEGYVKRSIFKTDSLHFGLYCLEPGQINARHKHPQNDEICYVVRGTGEIVIGDEIAAVEAGVFIHAHQTHIPHPKLSQREITERKNQSEHKNKHKERKKAFEKQ